MDVRKKYTKIRKKCKKKFLKDQNVFNRLHFYFLSFLVSSKAFYKQIYFPMIRFQIPHSFVYLKHRKYSYTIKKYIVHLCDAHFNHLLVQPLSLEEKKHNLTNLAVFF